jgi:hypothetical protein
MEKWLKLAVIGVILGAGTYALPKYEVYDLEGAND